MFIEKIEITNFRSIQRMEVDLRSVTAFLGRNGVGKSTVLYALETFYNVGAQYSALDYYNHQTDGTTIRIRVTYSDLRPDELAEFGSYVHGGRLAVTKAINSGGARYLGTTAQIPEFARLRRLGAADKRAGLQTFVTGGGAPDFPAPIPRRSEDVDRAMDEYETAHPELTEPTDHEASFFGPRNVGGGKLDKFTKFVLVPAVRDAATEMEKRGAIMQLLDLIVSRSIANRPDFLEFKQQFEERARQLYGRENLPELAELGRLVTQRLARYSPGAELSIDFDELKPPNIPLPDTVVSVSEDNFKVPVRYSGHGLQRALILALLEQLSMTQAPLPPVAEGEPLPIPRLPDLILAIEEPELYLHPARSRYLARILRTLASNDRQQAPPGTQVLYVTHSPYFVEVEHFDDVRMCRKVAADGEGPRVTALTKYSRLDAARRLADITGRDPAEFTERSFVTRASPVLTSLVNEGLFADVAVVVEGESDVGALWAMQSVMNERWDEKGIVVVPVSGKNNIDRAVVVFQGFGIPTYFMFDGDRAKNEGAATNRALLTLGGLPPVDFPATQVADTCAMYENDIEQYLRTECATDYERIRDECARRCGLDRPGSAIKSSDVMALFLTEAAAAGHGFPRLQEIVRRVSAIAAEAR
ncbi:MAG TPA: AAA family ATPase [Vicinamibacterales bacterium]|nr:AAA family ATPase [Vicinamibacterales bacterium]